MGHGFGGHRRVAERGLCCPVLLKLVVTWTHCCLQMSDEEKGKEEEEEEEGGGEEKEEEEVLFFSLFAGLRECVPLTGVPAG